MPRHPDFDKIYRQFMKRYCEDPNEECEKGKTVYYSWLNKLGLDDTKPYVLPQEAFRWAEPQIRFWKEDECCRYYRVEALFPLISMNMNVYSRDELIRACRTLIGKPVNMNHESPIADVSIVDADYEDDTVECVLKMLKDSEVARKIDAGDIVHVSIEADCLRGWVPAPDGMACSGLTFSGLALLDKNVLPGIPLTRIMPVETITEKLDHGDPNMSQNVIKEEEEEEQFADLPDSDFACILTDGDKKIRKLPIHDCDHVQNAMARFSQTEGCQTPEVKAKICRRAKECGFDAAFDEGGFCYEEEAIKKTPCESAKDSLLKRLNDLEEYVDKLSSIVEEELTHVHEQVINLMMSSPEPKITESAGVKTQEPRKILSKEGFWLRFRELRAQGLSQKEAYRLATMELLEASTKA